MAHVSVRRSVWDDDQPVFLRGQNEKQLFRRGTGKFSFRRLELMFKLQKSNLFKLIGAATFSLLSRRAVFVPVELP